MTRPTLRELSSLPVEPVRLADSALVLIDCQNTYTQGVMELEGVQAALDETAALLDRARTAGIPIIHIQHDSGPGSPYDIRADIGAIADRVAPRGDEPVVIKSYPNSFVQTELDGVLHGVDAKNLVLAGFMKLVGPAFLGRFGGRTINTHPALLPSFPGMHGPRDALRAGVKVSGATVFVVDAGVDTGKILLQGAVDVRDDDDVESLHERIKVVERGLLIQAVSEWKKEHP